MVQKIQYIPRRNPLTCENCGSPYETKHHKEQRFCSRKCFFEFKRKEKEKETKKYPKCKVCGADIKEKSHKPNKERIYCSRDCYYKDIGAKHYKYTECLYCKKPFKESRDRPNLFCSRSCSQKYNSISRTEERLYKTENEQHIKELKKEYRKKLKELEEIQYKIEHEKFCIVCKKLFIAENTQQLCCSKRCSNKYSNKKHDKRIYKNGKPDLSISLEKLYERDEGICQLCGKKIYFIEDFNSDDYPSIDHIVPLNKGGLHQWENVQLACRRCNSIKKDKIG